MWSIILRHHLQWWYRSHPTYSYPPESRWTSLFQHLIGEGKCYVDLMLRGVWYSYFAVSPHDKIYTSQPAMGGTTLLGKDRDLSGPRKAQQLKVRQLSQMQKVSLPFSHRQWRKWPQSCPRFQLKYNLKINRVHFGGDNSLFTNRRYVMFDDVL